MLLSLWAELSLSEQLSRISIVFSNAPFAKKTRERGRDDAQLDAVGGVVQPGAAAVALGATAR